MLGWKSPGVFSCRHYPAYRSQWVAFILVKHVWQMLSWLPLRVWPLFFFFFSFLSAPIKIAELRFRILHRPWRWSWKITHGDCFFKLGTKVCWRGSADQEIVHRSSPFRNSGNQHFAAQPPIRVATVFCANTPTFSPSPTTDKSCALDINLLCGLEELWC